LFLASLYGDQSTKTLRRKEEEEEEEEEQEGALCLHSALSSKFNTPFSFSLI